MMRMDIPQNLWVYNHVVAMIWIYHRYNGYTTDIYSFIGYTGYTTKNDGYMELYNGNI